MLVKRLSDSITRALEKVQEMAQRGPSCLIDDETDAAARKIETAEQASRQEWIENHSVPDEDGRARCSFHFCHKLFKDRAFLHKHLLKKHSDQLRAECAKCHDGPMMAAWDRDDRCPVPPVLVDCGLKFGLLQSLVTRSDSTASASARNRSARGGGGDDAPEGAARQWQRGGEEEVELRRSGRYGGGEGGAVVREREGRASAKEEEEKVSA